MKRVGYLKSLICDYDNLLSAYYKASKGKQSKHSVIEYSNSLHENLSILLKRLQSGTQQIGRYRYFKIYDPKERLICAASFEERIVHHAIMNICKDVFERQLIYDTFATREGKGVYSAIDRARYGMHRFHWVAKLDVRKYFDSISHEILSAKLRRLFKDKWLLDLLNQIIESYETTEGCGVPIGNLTSQYFANYYLSALDHYIKEKLKIPVYVRYMDDMLLFSDSKDSLKIVLSKVENYVSNSLNLTLKQPVIASTQVGVSFLGYKLNKTTIKLNGRSKRRFKTKMRSYSLRYEQGEWTELEYQRHLFPLLAYVQKAYTKRLRSNVIEELKIC